MLKEFRWFLVRGNAADIGIGLVLGAAVSGLIDSFVQDVLLPPFGLLLAKVNVANLYISLGGRHYSSLAEAQAAGAATINYGLFITSLVHFLIVLFVVFLIIRQMNHWKKPNQDPLAPMRKQDCPFCKMSIPAQAVKCPHCSSGLKAVETKSETIRIKENNQLSVKVK